MNRMLHIISKVILLLILTGTVAYICGSIARITSAWLNLGFFENSKPTCLSNSPMLIGYRKPITAVKNDTAMLVTEDWLESMQSGGYYRPLQCAARHKFAVLIPMRNRLSHLRLLLLNLIPFLQRQEGEFQIFVIEQVQNQTFNKGKLFNVGFDIAKKQGFQCFIFHDVDMVPENDFNTYGCHQNPYHLGVQVDTLDYALMYLQLVGGVLALTENQYVQANGFSNTIWGWGGEDDDLYQRLWTAAKFRISRPWPEIARYTMLKHPRGKDPYDPVHICRKMVTATTDWRRSHDGLTSLKYFVKAQTSYLLYEHILLDAFQVLSDVERNLWNSCQDCIRENGHKSVNGTC